MNDLDDICEEELKIWQEWQDNATKEELKHGYDTIFATVDDVIMVFAVFELPSCRSGVDHFFKEGDTKPSFWFTVYSDGEVMTVGREDFVSIMGARQLFRFMEIM